MLVKAEFQASPVSKKPGCRSHLQLRGSAGGAWIILAVFCRWSQHYAAHCTLPLGDRPGTRHHDHLTFYPSFLLSLAPALVSQRFHSCACVVPTSHYSCASTLPSSLHPLSLSPLPFASHTARFLLCSRSHSCCMAASGHVALYPDCIAYSLQ